MSTPQQNMKTYWQKIISIIDLNKFIDALPA